MTLYQVWITDDGEAWTQLGTYSTRNQAWQRAVIVAPGAKDVAVYEMKAAPAKRPEWHDSTVDTHVGRCATEGMHVGGCAWFKGLACNGGSP
jgi:hypothetical protein